MSTLSQSLTFVKQGPDVITINVNEIPLIPDNMANKPVIVVNFLRCGCPAVQVIYRFKSRINNSTRRENIEAYYENSRMFASDYEDKLQVMSQADETFSASAVGPYFFDPSNEEQAWVFEIRRSVKTPSLAPMEHSRPTISSLDE